MDQSESIRFIGLVTFGFVRGLRDGRVPDEMVFTIVERSDEADICGTVCGICHCQLNDRKLGDIGCRCWVGGGWIRRVNHFEEGLRTEIRCQVVELKLPEACGSLHVAMVSAGRAG